MIHVRDGLSFSNENSGLGEALLRFFRSRRQPARKSKPAPRNAAPGKRGPA